MNNYNALIKEATSIEWDKSQIDRFGRDYSDDENFWAIRATRYNYHERGEDYRHEIEALRTNALNEITLLSDEQVRQCIKRLTLISQDYFDTLFPTFTKWLGEWYSGQFRAFDFESKFFPLLNMKAVRVAYPDSPDFNELRTTPDFFSDLKDALMYKNGAILHLLYDLSVFVGDKVELFVSQHMKDKELREKWFAESQAYLKSRSDSENLPYPETPSEEWEQLVKYYAQKEFEGLRLQFHELHGDAITARLLREELEEIESFIHDTERIKTKDAYSRAGKTRFPHTMHDEDLKEEYVRLSGGYYTSDRSGSTTSLDNKPVTRRIDFSINGLPRRVYGKYFLYKAWIAKEIAKRGGGKNSALTNEAAPAPTTAAPAPTTAAPAISAGSKLSAKLGTVGLTERENVLVHCYREEPEILPGQPGYADYLAFGQTKKRIRYPDDKIKKAISLIKSIEKIYPYLTEAQKKQAEYEVITIESNFPDRL